MPRTRRTRVPTLGGHHVTLGDYLPGDRAGRGGLRVRRDRRRLRLDRQNPVLPVPGPVRRLAADGGHPHPAGNLTTEAGFSIRLRDRVAVRGPPRRAAPTRL